MFDKEQELEKLIKADKWDKIEKKFFYADPVHRLILAKGLAAVSEKDECYNMLFELIKDDDKDVQLAAVKSLGICGTDSAVARLQWVLNRTPESETKLIEEIHDAIKVLRDKK